MAMFYVGGALPLALQNENPPGKGDKLTEIDLITILLK
jgi:hypothetical protein